MKLFRLVSKSASKDSLGEWPDADAAITVPKASSSSSDSSLPLATHTTPAARRHGSTIATSSSNGRSSPARVNTRPASAIQQDTVLTKDYLQRVLDLVRKVRTKIESQGKQLSVDDLRADLSQESIDAPTVSLSIIDATIYSYMQNKTGVLSSPRKLPLSRLEAMNDGELLAWSEQFIGSIQVNG